MFEFFLKKLRIINYFLIVLIVLAILLFARNVISMSFSKKTPGFSNTQQEASTPAIAKIRDINDYAPILEQNLFGPPMKLISISTEQKSEKIASHTEFILIGTTTGPKNLSYAIFENKSRTDTQGQEIFRYGDNVYDYGILTKIEKDWVELTQGATTSKIYIVEPQTKEIQAKTNPSQTPFAKKLSEKQYVLDQQRVQRALKNPEQIMTDARLLPNIQNGKIEGFKMLEVKPNGLYDSLGLRNGDTLLKVNNLEVSNPEVAMQAISALGGMNSVSLDIIRDGARMTISYDIR